MTYPYCIIITFSEIKVNYGRQEKKFCHINDCLSILLHIKEKQKRSKNTIFEPIFAAIIWNLQCSCLEDIGSLLLIDIVFLRNIARSWDAEKKLSRNTAIWSKYEIQGSSSMCHFVLLFCQPLSSLLRNVLFTFFTFHFQIPCRFFIHHLNLFFSFFIVFSLFDEYFMHKKLSNLGNYWHQKILLFRKVSKCLKISSVNHVISAVSERSFSNFKNFFTRNRVSRVAWQGSAKCKKND